MIRRLSNVVTEQFQPGGFLLWMFAFCAAALLAAFSMFQPEQLHLSLAFILVFLGVGRRHYGAWRRTRLQRGLVPVRTNNKIHPFK